MGLATVATVAGIGSSLVGAGTSIYGAVTAGDAASQAADNTMAMYKQTRNDLLPYITGGTNAFGKLSNLMGMSGSGMQNELQNYPGYQWAQQQGVQALDRSAASRGLLLSGGQLKDVTSYGQGLANQLFNQYYNQLYGISSLGENAAAQSGNQGLSATSQANNYNIAGTNAFNSGLTGGLNDLFGSNSALNNYLISQSGGGGSVSGAGIFPANGGLNANEFNVLQGAGLG